MSAAARKNLHNIGGLDHSSLQRLLGYNLVQACLPTYAVFDRCISEPFELKQVEYTILSLVDSNLEVSPKQVSLALDIASPNLSVILDKLESRALIKRVRSEEDRRSQILHLTAKGRTLLRSADAAADTMEADLLKHLSVAEQAMLFELLQKIAKHRQGR